MGVKLREVIVYIHGVAAQKVLVELQVTELRLLARRAIPYNPKAADSPVTVEGFTAHITTRQGQEQAHYNQPQIGLKYGEIVLR